MMVEGFIREYLVYVPESAAPLGATRRRSCSCGLETARPTRCSSMRPSGGRSPSDEGFILVTICEQYSNTSVSVSHRDSHAFYLQLRDIMISEYPVDPDEVLLHRAVRGQLGHPELRHRLPGVFRRGCLDLVHRCPELLGQRHHRRRAATRRAVGSIPNYHIYGYGDLAFLDGGLWDDTQNRLDSWAQYHLAVNGSTCPMSTPSPASSAAGTTATRPGRGTTATPGSRS